MYFALMCIDELKAARGAIEEAMQIDREEQSTEGIAWNLLSLAFLDVRQGYYQDVEHILQEFIPLAQELADQNIIVTGIYVTGVLAAAQGQAWQAARLMGTAEKMALQGGFILEIPGRAWVEQTIQATKSRIGEAAWAQEYQAGQAFATGGGLTMEQAIAFALKENDA
jgi:hypothetical protein